MTHIQFENLIGKNISIVKKEIGSDFENKLFGKDFYYILGKNKKLYGIPYNSLTIKENNKKIVVSISIHFQKVIDSNFYEFFVEKYGKPKNILIIDKRNVISEVENDGQSLRKSDITLREGSFEEKPLYIIWKKGNYEIKAFLRHKQGISEITFKKI